MMNGKVIVTAAVFLLLPVSFVRAQEEKGFGQKYIEEISDNTKIYRSKRPNPQDRLFRSRIIDRKIAEVKKLLARNPYLAWMFENCYPNTLDTTVHYGKDANGNDDTFVYTGDIHAMWLRDSGAQVWPYVQF
ncbi:MAG: glycoside hydrolase family 125 protein, partial [Prevotella sp.]|nr:glycoside hydrolase family 125 protein [Prevotella sp.]